MGCIGQFHDLWCFDNERRENLMGDLNPLLPLNARGRKWKQCQPGPLPYLALTIFKDQKGDKSCCNWCVSLKLGGADERSWDIKLTFQMLMNITFFFFCINYFQRSTKGDKSECLLQTLTNTTSVIFKSS